MFPESRHSSSSLIKFLALASRSGIELNDFLASVIEHTVQLSSSRMGVLVFHSMPRQSGGSRVSDSISATPLFLPEGVSEVSGHQLSNIRETISECLKKAESDRQLYCLAFPHPTDDQASFDAILQSPSSLWFQLSDGRDLIGWIGLGGAKNASYSQAEVKAIRGTLSCAMLALNRLLLREHARGREIDINLVGRSEKFLEFERKLKQAARHVRCPVLIRGERGSGKELAAYAVHYYSARRDKPFIPVLGSALAESLQIDELFGHEKNAFTGATRARKGKFLAAEGGTIFLDEVGDLSPALQLCLLRVIERGEIQPIGRDFPIKVDARIVMATNKDLNSMVAEGHFRKDFYDRLNVIELHIPPLRERQEDILALFEHFLLKQCLEANRAPKITQGCICHYQGIEKPRCASAEFYHALQNYHWPGNVRELENLITRLVTMAPEEVLDIKHLPEYMLKDSAEADDTAISEGEDLSLDGAMKRHIERVLALSGNCQTQAARILGIPRTTLQAKMRRLRIGSEPKVERAKDEANAFEVQEQI